MAFLRSDNNQNLVKGAGGIAGEGTPVGGRSRTTAGRPGSWYNIQDFLSANPNPNIAQRVQQRAGESLGQAKGQMQTQIEGLQQAPTPEAYSTDRFTTIREGGIDPTETQSLRSFLGQTVESAEPGAQSYELTPDQQLKDVRNPFEGVKQGDFGSIMQWYGDAEPPSSDYTPGMQRMDQMLLRGAGIEKTLPSQMESQYQTEILDPIQQKREQLKAQQDESKKAFEEQRTNWTQGISSFLEGEDKKIQDVLAQQEQQLAEQNRMNLQDITGQYYDDLKFIYPTLGSPYTTKALGEFANPAMRYISRENVVAPDLNTAAMEYFTDPQGYADYNTLAGLLGQENPYDLSAQAFDPGDYEFDVNRMAADYRNKYRAIEQEKARNIIEQILGGDPFVYDWGAIPANTYDVPLYWDTKYGRIANEMAEAGQTIKPPAAQIDYQY